jgi:hypothetical protein
MQQASLKQFKILQNLKKLKKGISVKQHMLSRDQQKTFNNLDVV